MTTPNLSTLPTCRDCHQPIRPQRTKHIPGTVRYGRRKQCNRCYQRQLRNEARDAREARSQEPAPQILGRCIHCDRPLVSGHTPANQVPEGHARHEGKQVCNACAARRRRAQKLPQASPTFPPIDVLEQALCAQTDPALFYPERGDSLDPARAICSACPTRERCLQWAIDSREPFGIWGGHTAQERDKLRRRGAA